MDGGAQATRSLARSHPRKTVLFRRPNVLALLLVLTGCVSAHADLADLAAPPPLPPAAFGAEERVLSPEDLRADLDALHAGLEAAHFDLYARRDEASYVRRRDRLRAALTEPMRPSEALFVFQRHAAFGDIAHARVEGAGAVWARYRAGGGTALPVYPRVRDGRLFIAEAYADGLAVGEEIVAIEGEPAGLWLGRLTRGISGDTPYLRETLLETRFPLDLWLALGEVPSVTLTVRDAEGAERTVEAPTIDADTLSARIAASGTEAGADPMRREARMLPGGIAYLRPGPFYGVETPENPWDPSAFVAFVDESFEGFIAAGARGLLIDLRRNPGGDNSFSDPMIAWFADGPFAFASRFEVRSSAQSEASNAARIAVNPASAEGISGLYARRYAETPYGETFAVEVEAASPRATPRFEAPVFVLVDRYSFSNAVNVAALIQDYGFGVVLGEETADLATTYGAMETFTLPRSGLTVGYPKALIVRPSGEMAARGVVPDLAVPMPVGADEAAVLDTAVRAVRQALESEADTD